MIKYFLAGKQEKAFKYYWSLTQIVLKTLGTGMMARQKICPIRNPASSQWKHLYIILIIFLYKFSTTINLFEVYERKLCASSYSNQIGHYDRTSLSIHIALYNKCSFLNSWHNAIFNHCPWHKHLGLWGKKLSGNSLVQYSFINVQLWDVPEFPTQAAPVLLTNNTWPLVFITPSFSYLEARMEESVWDFPHVPLFSH